MARSRGAIHMFHTPTGIKCTSQPVKQVPFDRLNENFPAFVLPASQLHLGFDGLRDPFTNVNQSIPDSPHRQLLQALHDGANLEGTDYVRRLRTGTLDLRGPQRVGPPQLSTLASKFLSRKHEAEEGRLLPVGVYQVRGRWHVGDGKHRAALLDLLGEPVPCLDMSVLTHDSFYWLLRQRMAQQPAAYSRNLQFFERMLREA